MEEDEASKLVQTLLKDYHWQLRQSKEERMPNITNTEALPTISNRFVDICKK